MNINHKQKALIDELFNAIKEKYPEIIFDNLSTSPDDPEHIWINVLATIDETREMEMERYAAGLEADIHINFGYRISIMS